MKKLIMIVILIMTICVNVSSQIRLGYTKADLIEEFSEPSIIESATSDGEYTIFTVEDDRKYVSYFISNHSGITELTMIVPKVSGELHRLIERYNSNYVIISDKHWKLYTDSGIIDIKLLFNDYYYFICQ